MNKQQVVLGAVGIGLLLFVLLMWQVVPRQGVLTLEGDRSLKVQVAATAFARHQGLSGVQLEGYSYDGMLFTYPSAEVRTFVMRDMQFALDFVWIRDGKIVALDQNVPPPLSRSDDPEKVSSNPLPVDMVLELPAGGIAKNDLFIGKALDLK